MPLSYCQFFSSNQFRVKFFLKIRKLIRRDFCDRIVRVKFRNFHYGCLNERPKFFREIKKGNFLPENWNENQTSSLTLLKTRWNCNKTGFFESNAKTFRIGACLLDRREKNSNFPLIIGRYDCPPLIKTHRIYVRRLEYAHTRA